jgi:hypothetical protein
MPENISGTVGMLVVVGILACLFMAVHRLTSKSSDALLREHTADPDNVRIKTEHAACRHLTDQFMRTDEDGAYLVIEVALLSASSEETLAIRQRIAALQSLVEARLRRVPGYMHFNYRAWRIVKQDTTGWHEVLHYCRHATICLSYGQYPQARINR